MTTELNRPPQLCWCPQCTATWTGFRLAEHEGVDRDDDGRVMITCGPCWEGGQRRLMALARSRLVREQT